MLCLLSNYLLQSYKNFPFKLCWSKPWYMRERNGIADRNCTCMDYIRLLRREVPYLFGSQRHIEIEKVQGKIERSIVGSWTHVINYQLIFLSVRSNSNRYHWTHLEIFLKGFWNLGDDQYCPGLTLLAKQVHNFSATSPFEMESRRKSERRICFLSLISS